MEHQVQHRQLLQPKSLNLNIDVQHMQAAQGPDEVGQRQDGEREGGAQGEGQAGQWRTIPITRLDLGLDLTTGTDLENMELS